MTALKSAVIRQRHDAMRKCTESIRKHFNPLLLPANSKEVRYQLTQLFGDLAQHLRSLNQDVYPSITQSADAAVRAHGELMAAELRQMLPRLAEFNRRWSSPDSIRAQASVFIKEAGEVLSWLERRFETESSKLLPALDQQELSATGQAKIELAKI